MRGRRNSEITQAHTTYTGGRTVNAVPCVCVEVEAELPKNAHYSRGPLTPVATRMDTQPGSDNDDIEPAKE